jgi:hypothetical protein
VAIAFGDEIMRISSLPADRERSGVDPQQELQKAIAFHQVGDLASVSYGFTGRTA